jgi:hypothetical protein
MALKRKRLIITSSIILGVLLLLPLLLGLIVSLPSVQTRILNYLAYRSLHDFGAEFKAERVKLEYDMDLSIEKVSLIYHQEELITVQEITLDMARFSLKRRVAVVNRLTLNQARLMVDVAKGDSISNIEQFINSAFPTDSSRQDATWNYKVKALSLEDTYLSYQNANDTSTRATFNPNHIVISGLYATVKDIEPDSSGIGLVLEHMHAMVNNQFELVNLSSDIHYGNQKLDLDSMHLVTKSSTVGMDLVLEIDSTRNQDDLGRYRIDARFNPSWLNLAELAWFMPDIKGMRDELAFEGSIRGTLNNVKARDFKLSTGKDTRFIGDITLKGLPDLEETFINLNVEDLRTNISDISSIYLPGGHQIAELGIPDELKRLGSIRLNGYLTGFYYDFVSDANFVTDIGSFSTDLSLRNGYSLKSLVYEGDIVVNALDLGTLIDEKELLGYVSMNARVKGKGLDKNAEFSLQGIIDSVDVKGYNYDLVQVNGSFAKKKFDGRVILADDNIDLDFIGEISFAHEIPEFDFTVELQKAYLSRLKLIDRSGNPNLRASIKAIGKGGSLDDLLATVLLKDVIYTENERSYQANSISIQTTRGSNDFRGITLRSELVDADLTGRFKYTEMAALPSRILRALAPSIHLGLDTVLSVGSYADLELKVKNAGPLLKVIYPGLELQQGLVLKSRIERSGLSDISLSAPIIKYGEQVYDSLSLQFKGQGGRGLLDVRLASAFVQDSVRLQDLSFRAVMSPDSVAFHLDWDDPNIGTPIEGRMSGFISFTDYPEIDLSIDQSRIMINHTEWLFTHSSPIRIDTSFAIKFSDFSLSSRSMSLKANGTISRDPGQNLDVAFVDYNLDDLDFLSRPYGVNFDGIVNGKATLRNIFNEPNILSDLKIKDFVFNGDRLGDAFVRSGWNTSRKAVELNLRILTAGNLGADTTLKADGWYYPAAEKDQLDIDFKLKDFRIHALKNFLSYLTSDLSGTASGNLSLKGTLKKPYLIGAVDVYHARVKLDYLNTYYTFADRVTFEKDRIVLKDILLHDSNGPQTVGKTALLNGYVSHNSFRDFYIDLKVSTESFTFLNTSLAKNDYFYGRAVGGGVIRITGPADDIRIEADARSGRGTVFSVPLTYASNVSQVDFIQFVNKAGVELEEEAPRKVDLTGISMDFDLEVTPDAEVQLIFDEKIGDVIRGSGRGNLSMEIDARGEFLMFGSYEIQKGEYLFTLQNIVNKAFTIEPGGTITWTGNPYDAELDLMAKYTVYTSLHSLGLGLDTSRRRVPVECRLYLTGNLNHPNIERSIEFPGMNTFEAEQYKAAIAADLNYQFLALLVMNTFLYAGTDRQGIGTFAGSAIGTGYSEFISSQVSNWLSKLSSDLDVGVNYRPEDNLNAEKLQVILSTQLFNDRLSIDGNFDMAGENSKGAVQGAKNSSAIVGDVNVEYKITPEGKFRVRAFNRSNYHDVLNSKAPYTQGVGVFYRKEFNTFKELLED